MVLNITNLNIYALKTISKFPKLMFAAQRFRYFLMRGPLQKVFVRYLRNESANFFESGMETSAFAQIDIDKAVSEINASGYSVCLQIPDEPLSHILNFWQKEKSDNIHHPHRKCKVIAEIANDPQILKIVGGYFKSLPILYGSRLYYTPPRIGDDGEIPSKYKNAKSVHFDVADFMDLTVFFYLHDVDADTSPHIVFPGTHKGKKLKDFIRTRYTRAEAEKRFKHDFVVLTGKAGMGFIEDTSTFHIQSPGKKGRAVLSLCYTLHRRAELARYQNEF